MDKCDTCPKRAYNLLRKNNTFRIWWYNTVSTNIICIGSYNSVKEEEFCWPQPGISGKFVEGH